MTLDDLKAATEALLLDVRRQQDSAEGYAQVLWSPVPGADAVYCVDVYGEPEGWTLTVDGQADGDRWWFAEDCGADPTRSLDWQRVIPPG